MRKVKSNHITDSARLPFLKRTLDHLQDGNAEIMKHLAFTTSNYNTGAGGLVLWGVNPVYTTTTVTNDTLTITEGAILLNGEIYLIDADSATVTGSNVHILNITETGQTGEPTEYTDSTTYTTNVIRKLELSTGASGSGDIDFASLKYNHWRVKDQGLISSSNIFNSLSNSGTLSMTGAVISCSAYKVGRRVTLAGEISIENTSGSSKTLQLLALDFKTPFQSTVQQIGVGSGYNGSTTGTILEVKTQVSGYLNISGLSTLTVANGDVGVYSFTITYESDSV